ncbi:MAG: MarR family transcriptional regulator [Verrucomicrobia bacterium]|nr:MarR family transcriptional regulator [Verrucomicrobiota bacterium]
MPLLMLKDLPQYDCLLKASERYPGLDPTAKEAFLHLLRTGDMVFEEIGHFLTRHNISQGRFTVMALLSRTWIESFTPASLAEESGVTRATMTGLIDTLEKDGMVVRQADAHDRRTVHVSLTKQGQASLEAMLPDYFECVSRIMSPLNPRERKELVRLLQKIQEGLTPANLKTSHRTIKA